MEFTNISSCDSSKNGAKLLDAATEGRADDTVELLAQDPTVILIADAMGDTAFHIAARAGHGSTVLKMMEFLKLRHRELLEKVLCKGNADKDRPLHLALKNGHKDFAFDLALAKTSTIYMMNGDRKNAFHLAEEAGIHLSYERVSSVNKYVISVNGCVMSEIGSVGSDNEGVGSVNEGVGSDNEGLGSDNDNEGVGSVNEGVGSDNESLGSDNEYVDSDNENVSSGIEYVGSNNESVGSDNEYVGSDNEMGKYGEDDQSSPCYTSYEYNSGIVNVKKHYEEVVVRLALGERNATFKKEELVSISCVAGLLVDIQMKVERMNLNDAKEFLERKDSIGRTALHKAAKSGNMEPLKKMVEIIQYNSNLNKLLLEGDDYDYLPLHLAIEGGHENVARYLVEVAPRAVYKEDRWGKSPLKLAIKNKYPDLIRYMTRTDLSQSIRDCLLEHAKKIGIGHYALKNKHLATFEAILEGLPELINIPDRKGWKLLSYAASKGYFDEVRCILKRFPDSRRKTDEDESFPIHKAVAGGHISVVKEFLLHCPQALQDIDRKGRKPVEIATLYKRYDVLLYLKEINK